MLYTNNYPLSSSDIVYDYEDHMYRLTKDYTQEKTGVDLTLLINSPYIADKTIAINNFLLDVSSQIYNYIYSYNSRYQKYVEYLLAKSPMARDMLRKALLKQVAYVIRNGKINEFVGTNVSYNKKDASTSLEDLRGERSIHPEALQILKTPLEDGEKLIFTGDYYIPYNFDKFYRVGY